MTRVSVEIGNDNRLQGLLEALNFRSRRELLSVGANAMRILVVAHLRREAKKRHQTANRLGAQPTNHLEKGAARVTSRSDERQGEVNIPIVGISRAFHDVTITPVKASALTIPVNAIAYGHRAAELSRMGWKIFRPKGKDVLMGSQKDDKGEPITLYALKKRVSQRQDRSLLPSDRELYGSATNAMRQYVTNIIRRAS